MRKNYGSAHRPRDYKNLNESHLGKKILFWFVIVLLGSLFFLRFFYGFLPFPFLSPSKNFKEQSNARISVQPKELLKQTDFDCGAFNMSAAINTLSQRKTTPPDLIKEIGLKKFKEGILPETVVKILQSQEDVSAKIRTTRWLSDEDKIKYLKSELAQGHPLILFVQKEGFLHYHSLYGYEGDSFFVYDSWLPEQNAFFTVDNNGEEIGNGSLASATILKMWGLAEKFNMYQWVVISVFKK
jgi:hypothetical protein